MRRFLVFLLAVGMAVSSAMLAPVSEAAAGDSSSGSVTVDAQDPYTWLGAGTAFEAVQFAVDGYEVVNLLGTFDFGDGSVFIGHSVEILGDYRTTILGGGWGAFASYDDRSAHIAVKDIQFDGAEAALVVAASGYVEVTGSQFRNIGRSWGGYGIVLNGGCWELAGAGVSGEVLIKGNYFDNSPAGDFSGGVLAQCVSADTEVSDNVVENFQLGGIFVNSLGEIRVKNNTINAGSTPSTSWFRNGITVGSWYFLVGGQGVLRVTDNTITTGGHIADNGIVTEDYEQSHRSSCTIADNEITYVGDAIEGFGIGLLARSSDCKYEDNDIDGGGHELYAGVALYPGIDPGSPGGEQKDNTFIGNEIHNATVRQAGVYIDSSALTENNRFKENELEDINGTGFVVHGDDNRFIENELENIGGDGFHLFGDYNLLRDNDYGDLGGACVVDLGVGNRIRGEGCDPKMVIRNVIGLLDEIIDVDPESDLADKLEDVSEKLDTAFEELDKHPADTESAAGAIEGAVGDLEAAIEDNLFDDPADGAIMAARILGVARQLAVDAIADAQGGDEDKIEEARQYLADGDDLRSEGKYKDAAAAYKDAISKAVGA